MWGVEMQGTSWVPTIAKRESLQLIDDVDDCPPNELVWQGGEIPLGCLTARPSVCPSVPEETAYFFFPMGLFYD